MNASEEIQQWVLFEIGHTHPLAASKNQHGTLLLEALFILLLFSSLFGLISVEQHRLITLSKQAVQHRFLVQALEFSAAILPVKLKALQAEGQQKHYVFSITSPDKRYILLANCSPLFSQKESTPIPTTSAYHYYQCSLRPQGLAPSKGKNRLLTSLAKEQHLVVWTSAE